MYRFVQCVEQAGLKETHGMIADSVPVTHMGASRVGSGRGGERGGGDSKVEGHLASLLAVLQAEARDAESALASGVAALPALATACEAALSRHRGSAPHCGEDVRCALAHLPTVRAAADQTEQRLVSALHGA